MVDVDAIVIDAGSGCTKAGFAIYDLPTYVYFYIRISACHYRKILSNIVTEILFK
jgi:hypothetical protein